MKVPNSKSDVNISVQVDGSINGGVVSRASISNGPIELPGEWGWVRLGELFDIQQGKALNSRDRGSGELRPFLRTANVFWGKLELVVVDKMGFTKDERERLALRPGDLLTCEGGDVGRTAVWGGEISTCLYQNHLHRLRPKRPDVEPEFYMRWMEVAFQQLDIYSGMSNKTTIPNLSKNRLASFAVPHPPLSEQRAIATVIRTVQQTKEACERVIAATRQLKKSLLQYLFTYGPVPFDQADQVPLKETELGLIPERWVLTELASVARLIMGQSPPSNSYNIDGDGLPFLQGKAEFGRRHPNPIKYCSTPHKISPKNSVLVSVRAPVGDANISDREYCIGRGLSAIHPKVCLDVEFLFGWLVLKKGALESKGSGSIFKSINKEVLTSFRVPVPSIEEQHRISEKLVAVDIKLAAEESRRDALANLFQSLLHHLMTGKVRVTA